MLRWKEEHTLVNREIDWVVNYFQHQQVTTMSWGLGLTQTPYQRAWAARCASIWRLLKDHANTVFASARVKLEEYNSLSSDPVPGEASGDEWLDSPGTEQPPGSEGDDGSSDSDDL